MSSIREGKVLTQVSPDLLIWNDAHMQPRAQLHHVVVLTGKFVNSSFPKVFVRLFLHPRHQVRNKLDGRRQQIYHDLIFF